MSPDDLDIFDWGRANLVSINDEKGEEIEKITPEEQLIRIIRKRKENIEKNKIQFDIELCGLCRHILSLHDEVKDVTKLAGRCNEPGCLCENYILT